MDRAVLFCSAVRERGDLAHGTHGTQQHKRSLRRVVLRLSCIKVAEECLIRLGEKENGYGQCRERAEALRIENGVLASKVRSQQDG